MTAAGERGTEQACEGLVRLLSNSERNSVELQEQAAETLREADTGDPAPDLLLAQAYERLGLFEDAITTYETALRFGPNRGAESAMGRLKRILAR